ncbi:MAG: hypothetical protein EAZ21_10785 [Betaproteobacteria bacterium]|nr:MAG: hypothetical protein EAZ21_10785 [Betaproteobacteria bacterium]
MKRVVTIICSALVLAALLHFSGGWHALASTIAQFINGSSEQTTVNGQQPGNVATDRGVKIAPYALGAAGPSARQGGNAAAIDALNRDPNAQLSVATSRYERANEVLDAYRKHTQYPFDSRPAREHQDQMYPNAPVVEDQKLKSPGQKPSQSVFLRTTQERVYAQGSESVLFSVTALDANGIAYPINFLRAIAHDPPKDGKPSKRNAVQFPFNDAGQNGDATPGDSTYSARLSPARQGFDNFHGNIRVELSVAIGEQTGFLFFDVFYTPDPPALWRGAVRETLERGSLNFYLPIDVRTAGRYVVTGRIDDAKGQPFALVNFNDELAVGAREVRFNVFGKLLVDEAPAFPLTLRDIDGFLLLPDTDPDRALVQRLSGKQHVSRSYALSAFSDAEWDSEERRRYLEEYGRDVESARAYLEHIRRTMKPNP